MNKFVLISNRFKWARPINVPLFISLRNTSCFLSALTFFSLAHTFRTLLSITQKHFHKEQNNIVMTIPDLCLAVLLLI